MEKCCLNYEVEKEMGGKNTIHIQDRCARYADFWKEKDYIYNSKTRRVEGEESTSLLLLL